MKIDTYFMENEESTFGNSTAKKLSDFLASAEKNAGFYISRFEAGTEENLADSEEPHIVFKQGKKVYTNMSQIKAANLAREIYSISRKFESDLINSYAWDTALKYIQICSGDDSYIWNRGLGGDIKLLGESEDIKCNIYDMAGNACEWTTESSSKIAYRRNVPYTVRGGRAGTDASRTSTACTRGATEITGGTFIGFRRDFIYKIKITK